MIGSNYTILQRNTLDGLSETAGSLYLALCDAFVGNERNAFLAACDYETKVGATLDHILTRFPGFQHLPAAVVRDLSRFFAKRWQHNFMQAAV